MSIKNVLSKAVGLFAEFPEEQASAPVEFTPSTPSVSPRSVQEVVNATPGPKLEEINMGTDPVPQITAPSGVPDFRAVYLKAGLPDVPFTAEQALDVISSLPQDLPIDVRRRTVQATLQTMGKAIGVNTDSVLGDATRKLAALAAYEETLKTQTAKYISGADAQIADLEKQIEAHKQDIENTRQMLDRAVKRTTEESERLDDVLEFFTLDVGASKYATPGS